MTVNVYVRAIPPITEAQQRRIAADHIAFAKKLGAPRADEEVRVYADTLATFPASRTRVLSDMRPGDLLMVARLAVLAKNDDDLVGVMRELGSREVFEIETVRHSSNSADLTMMILDANRTWRSYGLPFRNSSFAAAAGAKGGAEAARRRESLRMPVCEAQKIWRDTKLSTGRALERINADRRYQLSWSQASAYRVLGPREAPAGRPKKKPRK